MADEIRLVTFEGQNVAPINDALMWETAIGDSGVIYGCETTLKDASTLHIETGYGVVCGRHFQIFESDIPVTLSPGGDLLGRLYVHMDLSDASEPIQLLVETAASLTPVEQDDNVNITNGVWEFNLATFDLNALTISNLVNVFPTVAGGGSNLIAGTETGPNASEAYVAGQYIIWASRLWEVIDAIAVGDQFVIGSNLSATNTTVGSELTKLNDSISDVNNPVLLLDETVNNTYTVQDITQFKMLLFCTSFALDGVFDSIYVPTSLFKSLYYVCLQYPHVSNGYNANNKTRVSRISDTSIKIENLSAYTMHTYVYGIK